MRYAKSIQPEKSVKSAVTRRVLVRRGGLSDGMGSMNFEVPVSVRLDKSLYGRIKAYAKNNSLGVGAAIRMLLVKGLKTSLAEDEGPVGAAN